MSTAETFEVRVYYEDTDFSGNVYHAAYLQFFERARTEFLRAHGIWHRDLALDGIAFAVSEMHIAFKAPARIDDLLRVETQVVDATGARLILEQTIMRDEALLTTAKVEVVAIRNGRATRLPRTLTERLSAS